MKYSTILWDMDGVLMDSEPQHYRAWERTLKEYYGVEKIDWERYKPCIGGKYSVVADVMMKGYGADVTRPEVHEAYLKYKREVEEEEGYRLMPHLAEVLAALHAAGFRMAVASSSPFTDIERFVETCGLSEYFELLFTGEQVKNSKPAPDTFLEAAKRMSTPPEACIVVEDSENGAAAAKAAGMYCIGLKNPGSGDQKLDAADSVIGDIREISELCLKLRGEGIK